MDYFKKAPLFFIVLISLWYVGLFSYFNQGMISLEVPYIGTFKLAAAIAILGSFVSGAVFACIFFAYDAMRKSWMIRSSQKTIKNLQNEVDRTTTPSSSELTESQEPKTADSV